MQLIASSIVPETLHQGIIMLIKGTLVGLFKKLTEINLQPKGQVVERQKINEEKHNVNPPFQNQAYTMHFPKKTQQF